MKKHSIGSRILSVLLSLAMVLPMLPMTVSAEAGVVGDFATEYERPDQTGLGKYNIDTQSTINLPIEIYDYYSDGMLFEYAESKDPVEDPKEFGAVYTCDYTNFDSNNLNSHSNGLTDYKATWIYYLTDDYKCTFVNDNADNQYMQVAYGSGDGVDYVTYFTAGSDYYRRDQHHRDKLYTYSYKITDIPYLVMVYKIAPKGTEGDSVAFSLNNGSPDKTNGVVTNPPSSSSGTKTSAYTLIKDNNWHYVIVNLTETNIAETTTIDNVVMHAPIQKSGDVMNLAYISYFNDYGQAKKFGEYAITKGSDNGDNRGFGLLRGSRDQDGDTNYAGIMEKTSTLHQMIWKSSNQDYADVTNLGYKLYGTFYDHGIANIGMLESSLSEDGYPVYKDEVVRYLAGLLEEALQIPERTEDGWKNYRFVKGTEDMMYSEDGINPLDLAEALRRNIDSKSVGAVPTDEYAKNLIGKWENCKDYLRNYTDAAYYLLNNIFVRGSYNVPQDDFDYLTLSQVTDGSGTYVFDAGFTNAKVESENPSPRPTSSVEYIYNLIRNSNANAKAEFYFEAGNETPTTYYPFLPVYSDYPHSDDQEQTQTVYYQDDGVLSTTIDMDTYVNRNFNYVIHGHGNFDYKAIDELYFRFEGDDDVYLFINGELVLDIGSAHGIDKVDFYLRDYVTAAWDAVNKGNATERDKKLALEDGKSYRFDFFYMERHGFGANMRIQTNIHVTDPNMLTEKTAYQNGIEINDGGIVNKDQRIEYGFSITNNSESGNALINLGFNDPIFGIAFNTTSDEVMELADDSPLTDLNGGTLDVSDLIVTLTDPSGKVVYTYQSESGSSGMTTDLLKKILHSPEYDSDNEAIGLRKGYTLTIRGFAYTLTDAEITAGGKKNIVYTEAYDIANPDKKVTGSDDIIVYVPADPMYYQWAGHTLKVSRSKLFSDMSVAASIVGNPLYDEDFASNYSETKITSVKFVNANGNPTTYSQVSYSDTDKTFSINYSAPGSYIFYLTMTFSGNVAPITKIPVLVNVTDVTDSTIVLDYGLPVELDMNALLEGDAVTVPGRATSSEILAFSTPEIDHNYQLFNFDSSYKPNSIGFKTEIGNTYEGRFGTFEFDPDKDTITYTPTRFIEGSDSIQIAVSVYENDIADKRKDVSTTEGRLDYLDINNEVQMYKTITILPANVMYYEDNFKAIKLNNDLTTPETNTNTYKQSSDQHSEYGSDPTYADFHNTTMSAGTRQKINLFDEDVISKNGVIVQFDFVGTGFEVIAETNAINSGIVVLEAVITSNTPNTWALNNGDTVLRIPVITEFDNGANGGKEAIYQVPIVRKNLDYGNYNVKITAIPTVYDDDGNKLETPKETYLHFDGVRIFNPLGTTSLIEAYNATEKGAEFHEVRKLIQEGNAGVVTVNAYGNPVLGSGSSTWTEDRNDNDYIKTNNVETIDAYMYAGPNNEAYMYGETTDSALVFYVEEDSESTTHSLQIAVRAIDDVLFFVGEPDVPEGEVVPTSTNSVLQYGNGNAWYYLVNSTDHALSSSTEQYYTIDYTKCPFIEDKGCYQVVIKVDSGMVSFSSIKTVGLNIVDTVNNFEECNYKYVNGILHKVTEITTDTGTGTVTEKTEPVSSTDLPAFYSIFRQMESDVVVEVAPSNVIIVPDYVNIKRPPQHKPIIPCPPEDKPEEPDEPKTYTIRGSVTSFGDDTADILIQLIPDGDTEPAYEVPVTGNDTEYVIENVEAGRYQLQVSKKNHVTRTYAVTVGSAE